MDWFADGFWTVFGGFGAQNRARNWSESLRRGSRGARTAPFGSRWAKNGPKWAQDAEIVAKMRPERRKSGAERRHGRPTCPKSLPKWSPNGEKTVPKLIKNDAEIDAGFLHQFWTIFGRFFIDFWRDFRLFLDECVAKIRIG